MSNATHLMMQYLQLLQCKLINSLIFHVVTNHLNVSWNKVNWVELC